MKEGGSLVRAYLIYELDYVAFEAGVRFLQRQDLD